MTLAALGVSVSLVTGCYLSHPRSESDGGRADAGHGCEGVLCESPPSECHQRIGVCTGEGFCTYAPIGCASAPAPSCVDASTLRTYADPGACRAGACSYPSTDIVCPFGCEAGRCADCTAVPWTTSTIDTMDRKRGGTSTLMTTSIAVDRVGGIHVAYQDGDLDRNLGYAHRVPGAGWTRSVIEFDGFGGAAVLSLALDDTGPHAFFIDIGPAPNAGYYASLAPGGAWMTERVESSVADNGYSYPSFAVDGMGGVHVSSAGHGDLRYAHRGRDGEWITSIVDPEASGAFTSIATDGAGGVHVAYGQSGAVAGRPIDVRHAYRGADGVWTTTTIDTAIVNPWVLASLAADASGRVHVGYFQWATGNVVVASRSPAGAWTTSTVDADMRGGGGGEVSLAADEEGGIHVVYRAGLDARLHYAFRGAAGTWTTTTVDPSDYGVHVSLAVDHAGGVHIAYYDWSTMSLRHAYQRVCH